MTDTQLPLVIGCTGHRDLRPEDVPHLEEKFRELVQSIQAQCPSTPIVILAALADGADRLVARVARAMGVPYYVALPLEKELYETDFETEESRREFYDLI